MNPQAHSRLRVLLYDAYNDALERVDRHIQIPYTHSMKRFIAIIVISLFGFTPFCGVFAMSQTMSMGDHCVVMESPDESDGHQTEIKQSPPSLSCCQPSASSQDEVQISSLFAISFPVFDGKTAAPTLETTESLRNSFRSNSCHPPDDFERISVAKRE